MTIFNKTEKQLQDLQAIATAREIKQQPHTWQKTWQQIKSRQSEINAFIDEVMSFKDYQIILAGAGTSEYIGNTLAAKINCIHQGRCRSVATTDLITMPHLYLSSKQPTLLVSFGRSGNSPESVGAILAAESVCDSVYLLMITCNQDGQLAKVAQSNQKAFCLCLSEETNDQSFAMTSSFTNMLLAARIILDRQFMEQKETDFFELMERTNELLTEDYHLFQKLIDDFSFDRIVYLGAGPLKGIAQEAALKMLELTQGQVTTLFDTPLGFRHGPKSVLTPNTLTVLFASDEKIAWLYEQDLVKEISEQRKGNRILVIGNRCRQEIVDWVDAFYFFKGQPASGEVLGMCDVVCAQLLALFKSLSLNMTPDNPCSSGEVNRVVQGVTLYPITKE